MRKIYYEKITNFDSTNDIFTLYEDAGWTMYTKSFDNLINGFNKSLLVIGAFDDNKLVGLIRVVGDEHTIIYIQDLIVLKAYQRQKIATNLIDIVLNKYSNVRQIILMSDNDDSLIKFYNSNKFMQVEKYNAVSYMYVK